MKIRRTLLLASIGQGAGLSALLPVIGRYYGMPAAAIRLIYVDTGRYEVCAGGHNMPAERVILHRGRYRFEKILTAHA